mmetsp:Transcript_14153/g.12816  ORF Transcript_14153/g.12816 Transcript_14153/m.12816 type:complete len:916 (-) Transcript_14153:1415-4162(-)
MSEIRQNSFDILEDDKKRSKSKANGHINDTKQVDTVNEINKNVDENNKLLENPDESNWTPVQQSNKSRRLVPHYTLSRHDLGAESRTKPVNEPIKKKTLRYTKEEILELRKPTKILDEMISLGDIISFKPLEPLLASPLSSEEITKLWNYERKNDNKDSNNKLRGKARSKGDEDHSKDDGEWNRHSAIESADGANFWDDDGLSNESTVFDLADLAAATLKFKSETLDLSSFKDMIPIQEEVEDNEDEVPEWAMDDVSAFETKTENQSKSNLLKEALNMFSNSDSHNTDLKSEIIPESNTIDLNNQIIVEIKTQQPNLSDQLNHSEPVIESFIQSTKSFDNLINSTKLIVEDWLYTDPQGNVQGPFSIENMRSWLEAGYFTPDLPVKMRHWSSFYPLAMIYPNYSESFRSITDEPNRRIDPALERQRMLEEQRRSHEQQLRIEQELRIQQHQQQVLLQKQQQEEQQRFNQEAAALEARQRAVLEQRRQQELYEERLRQEQTRRQQEALIEEQRKQNEQQMLYAMEKQREQQALAEQEHRRRQDQILMERRRQEEQKRILEQQEQQRQQKLFYERQRQLQLLEEQKRQFEQNNNLIAEQQRNNNSSAPWAKPPAEPSKLSKASLIEIQQKEEAEMMELRRQEALARSQNKVIIGGVPWSAANNSQTKSLLEIQIEEENRRQALEAERAEQQRQSYSMSSQLKSILGVQGGLQNNLNLQRQQHQQMGTWVNNNNLSMHSQSNISSNLSLRDIMKEEQTQLYSQGKDSKPIIGSWAAKAAIASPPVNISQTQSRTAAQVNAAPQNIPHNVQSLIQASSTQKVSEQNNSINNSIPEFNDMPAELAEWCTVQIKRFSNSAEISTLLQFCYHIPSAGDIREYLSANLGSTPQVSQFATEFIRKREASLSNSNTINSKKKNKK